MSKVAAESVVKMLAIIVGAVIFILVVLAVLGAFGFTLYIKGVSGTASSPLCQICRSPCNLFAKWISETLQGDYVRELLYILTQPLLKCSYCKPFCG